MTSTLQQAATPIAEVEERHVAVVRGRVQYVEVSSADAPARLLVRLADATGQLDCIFVGRRVIAGIEPGVALCVEGRIAAGDVPVIFNPRYELCAP